MKRAQSIEVLPVNDATTTTNVVQSSRGLIRKAVAASDAPPLPPKGSLDKVVNSLANDNMVIVDTSEPTTPHKLSTSSSESALISRRAAIYKRRSSFGVEERELPAPDTVKETRKIFESRSGGRMPGPFIYGSRILHMTKSKSTSNLYQFRSQSVDRHAAAVSNIGGGGGKQVRRKSQDDSSKPAAKTTATRRASSPAGPISSPTRTIVKPSLPSKPAHLASSSSPRTLREQVRGRVQEATSSSS